MFKIGEFSKIAQVTISQLHHYDEIGLFAPSHIDQFTGYRYYDADQLPRLNRILALRGLGLSLPQIQRLIDEDISAEEIQGMFTLKKAQLEQVVQEELARLRSVEARLRHLTQAGDMTDFDVVVKSIPEQWYLSVRDTFADFNESLGLVGELMLRLPNQIPQKKLSYFMGIFHDEAFNTENAEIEMGFLLNSEQDIQLTLSADRVLTVRKVPAVSTMVTAIRLGAIENGHLSYGAIGTWMQDNHYRSIGPAREVILKMASPTTMDDTIVEIQFPVEKIDPPLLVSQ
ncbi:MAG: MerR family transcriptional regulator [Chloroflexota bacterium]